MNFIYLLLTALSQASQSIEINYIPTTKTPPSGRINPLLIFHESLNSIILFGGQQDSNFFSDLYIFSLTLNSWDYIIPITQNNPDPRSSSGGFASNTSEKFYTFGGISEKGPLNDLWEFNIETRKWLLLDSTTSPCLSFFAYDFGLIQSKFQFVVFGGKGLETLSSSIYFLDTETWKWTQGSNEGDPPPPSYSGVLKIIDEKVWVLAGNGNVVNNQGGVFIYDPDESKWKNVNKDNGLKTYSHRQSVAAAVYNKTIFLISGWDLEKNERLSEVTFTSIDGLNDWKSFEIDVNSVFFGFVQGIEEVFLFSGIDQNGTCNTLVGLDMKEWKSNVYSDNFLSPEPRQGHQMHACYGHLYIFGGKGQKLLNDLWKLDLESQKWSIVDAIGTLPPSRFAYASSIQGDSLIIWGGEGRLGLLNDLYLFNLLTLTWQELKPLSTFVPQPAKGACLVIDAPLIYIYGGRNQNGLSTQLVTFNLWTYQYSVISSDQPSAFCSCKIINSTFIYSFGKDSSDSVNRKIRSLDLKTLIWSTVIQSSDPNTLFVEGNHFYIGSKMVKIGGISPNRFTSGDVILYNFENKTERFIGNLDQKLFRSASLFYQGNLFIHGGGESFGTNPREGSHSNLMFYIEYKEICKYIVCEGECSAGEYFNGTSCVMCPAGTYSSGYTTLVSDLAPNEQQCLLCPVGTYNPQSGASNIKQCYPCSEGTYNNKTGQQYCRDCPELTDCPSGSIEPSILIHTASSLRVTPKLYSSKSIENSLKKIEIIISLFCVSICLLILKFWTKVGFLKKIDIFLDKHNYILSKQMVLMSNKFGIIATFGFYCFVIIFLISIGLNYIYNNILEEKTLLPGPVLNQEVDVFVSEKFFVKILLEQFGDLCSDQIVKVSSFGVYYKSKDVKVEEKAKNICQVIFECNNCSFDTGSYIYLNSTGKNSYASGFTVNITSSSSIPNEISSIQTKMRSSKNKVFIGSTAGTFFYTLTPSLFHSDIFRWPSELTGFHLSETRNAIQGSELSTYELSMSSLLQLKIFLTINYSGLYTRRFVKTSIYFVIAGFLGTVFGILTGIGLMLKVLEKMKRVSRRKLLRFLEYKRMKFLVQIMMRNFDEKKENIQNIVKDEFSDNGYRLTLEY